MAAVVNPGGAGMPIAEDRGNTAAGVLGGGGAHDREAEVNSDLEKRASSPTADNNAKPDDDRSSSIKQEGVAKAEVVTQMWSKKVLWTTFVLIYLITIVESLLTSVQGVLSPYVTSEFGRHGLLGTVNIVSTIVSGVSNLTIAKVINIWGRMHGLLATAALITVGMVMKATCQNVETYAAAEVLYWVGRIGLLYIVSVTLADMTSLRNRMIVIGFNSTPTIVSYWAGPDIADLFYTRSSFRWAFGAFAVVLLGVCVPTVGVFLFHERKAKAAGMIQEKSGRTAWESTKHYLVQFDIVGLLLVTVGWSLLLLPFSLNTVLPGGWRDGGVVPMFVLGPVCLAGFYLWERCWTPVPFFPWKYLTDRTVLGACLAHGFMYASIFAWDIYYGSFLQVANHQSIANSAYIVNSFSLVSPFCMPFIGVAIRRVGKFKYIGLASMPFLVLAVALLVKLRTPETHVGLLVMTQAFNGIGSALLVLASQIAVMASVGHNEVAVGLALHSMFGGIGSAVGIAISGAIWTNLLPGKIEEALPDYAKVNATLLYGSLALQTEATGEVRDAVVAAYADIQHKMVVAGRAFTPCILIGILIWRNLNVKTIELERGPQTKGNVW